MSAMGVVASCEKEQDVHCILQLPDEGKIDLPCESNLVIPSFLEVHNPFNSQMRLDAQLTCENCINLPMESADPSCVVDVDIGKGNLESPTANNDASGGLYFEGAVRLMQRTVCRQINEEIGGKLMQLLINYGLMLLKFKSRDKPAVESPRDTPNQRWRKYKRSASFDSRKIVLLFSALSSMGTLVLIYLTLRVRQTVDGYVHV